VRIEAWGPDASACYEEAIDAFVELFAATSGAPVGKPARREVGPGTPEELLVLLLDEVLRVVEVDGLVPVATHVQQPERDRLTVMFTTVPAAAVTVIGPIPKGVSYYHLFFGATKGGWRCRATIDV